MSGAVFQRQRGHGVAEQVADHPIFLALALADGDDTTLQIKIEQLQVDQFQPPHPVE